MVWILAVLFNKWLLISELGECRMDLIRMSTGWITEVHPFSGGREVGGPPSRCPWSAEAIRYLCRDLICIFGGCLIFAIGLNALTALHPVVSGGVTGIALLVNYMVPELDIGELYLLLNLPLIVLGWRRLGRRFLVLTIIGSVFFSLAALGIKPQSFIIHDRLIATLLWGVICGLGAGMILRSRGSAGGVDILSIILSPKLGVSVATLGFVFNVAPLITGLWLLDWDTLFFSCLFFFIYSRVVDAVMRGIHTKPKQMTIHNPYSSATDCEGGEQRDAKMEPIRYIPAEYEELKRSKQNQVITDLAA